MYSKLTGILCTGLQRSRLLHSQNFQLEPLSRFWREGVDTSSRDKALSSTAAKYTPEYFANVKWEARLRHSRKLSYFMVVRGIAR